MESVCYCHEYNVTMQIHPFVSLTLCRSANQSTLNVCHQLMMSHPDECWVESRCSSPPIRDDRMWWHHHRDQMVSMVVFCFVLRRLIIVNNENKMKIMWFTNMIQRSMLIVILHSKQKLLFVTCVLSVFVCWIMGLFSNFFSTL